MYATPEQLQDIFRRIEEGESMFKACKANNVAPSTLCRWMNEDASIAERYARAREVRAEVIFDELDTYTDEAANAADQVKVAGLRLKVDTLKWKLARMSPRKYGDKVEQTVIGANGGPVQTVTTVNVNFKSPTSDN